MKKLPKQICVTLDEEGTENEFLNVHKSADEGAEQGVTKRAGIYILKELVTIRGVASVSPLKRAHQVVAILKPKND